MIAILSLVNVFILFVCVLADAQFCTSGESIYDHGATWATSECSDCTCNNDMVSCDHTVCPALTCTETEDVGQCCEQCKGRPNNCNTLLICSKTFKYVSQRFRLKLLLPWHPDTIIRVVTSHTITATQVVPSQLKIMAQVESLT